MEYKVVPFHPTVTDKGGAGQASQELQGIIDTHVKDGWKFKSLESLTTSVKPTGCAGLGGKNETVSIQMIVFEK
jgi:hypothetical protein